MAGTPEERAQLAAEMALGVLEGEERALARTLLVSDSGFRADVGRWLGRYAPMLAEVQPVEPPERVWVALEQQLNPPLVANDNGADLRRRLNVWRGIAAAASALAASLAVVMVTRSPEPAPPSAPSAPQRAPAPTPTPAPMQRSEPPPAPAPAPAPPPMIAILDGEQKAMTLVASWNPGERELKIVAGGDTRVDAAHSHELWVIPAGGKPRSLGTLPTNARMQTVVDPSLSRRLQQGATLAVSVEPRGGSRTGLPTGPVIASGKLERV